MKVVKKKKVARELKTPDKAQVVGISGSPAFWTAVDKHAKKNKVSRSAVIVEAVSQHLNSTKLGSNPVGRPRRKVVKK